jgi:xylan 1,4-beta-xylosidase
MNRTSFRALALAFGTLLAATSAPAATPATATATAPIRVALDIDAQAAGRPFPHFWEQMFGSGRAELALHDDYRRDLRTVKAATGFRYMRFHGILADEVGVYREGKDGKPAYNFSYVDQIYDGLLENGVRPFVELSFMPKQLASDLVKGDFPFFDHPNVSPPKDYAKWDALIDAFARHLVERYGIDEVAQWYFEVWNEPNIGFWAGEPRESSYYELYDHTARALKAVSPQLRVGGPSTAQAAWAGRFIKHVTEAKVPADFVSSHVYANDLSQDVFQNDIPIARDEMVCLAVRKVHEEIAASAQPKLPLIFSEYNASYSNEPNVTDSVYMGPWLAGTVSQCDGLIDSMSYWTFSDVFDEQGVEKTPFYGGFGTIAQRNIPKPAFNAFALLHKLGAVRLPLESGSALATRHKDGHLAIALWNYAPPDGTGEQYTTPAAAGAAKHFSLNLKGLAAGARATVWRLDADHGNVLKAFDAMGRPAFPSRKQIVALKAAGRQPAPESLAVEGGKLELVVPTHGMALVELH